MDSLKICLCRDNYWYHDEEILRIQDIENVFNRHLHNLNSYIILDNKEDSYILTIYENKVAIYSTTFDITDYDKKDSEIELYQDIILEIYKILKDKLDFTIVFKDLSGWNKITKHNNSVSGLEYKEPNLSKIVTSVNLASKVISHL